MPRATSRGRAAALTTAVVTLTGLLGPVVGTSAADARTTTHANESYAARTATTAKPRTTVLKVLVVPAYWDRNTDDAARLRTTFAQANAYWSKQSGGRFRMSVTVLAPVKVRAGCSTVETRAVAAAARGHRIASYGLVAVMAPTCAKTEAVDHLAISRTASGQRRLTAYGAPRRELRSVVRALGRAALGLGPSEQRLCEPSYRRIIDSTTGGVCSDRRSRADLDPLSDGSQAGNLSAAGLSALGWLGAGSQQTLTGGTRTVTLAPLGSSGRRAIRVRISQHLSYWVEYRHGVGADAGHPSSFVQGVLVRRLERNPAGLDGDAVRPSLLVMRPRFQEPGPLLSGESWTSPQRVRISVGRTDAAGARITVRFGAPKPTAPAAVRVSVAPGRSTLDVRWTRSADHGLPIDGYEVSVLDRRGTEVSRFQSQQVATRVERLSPPDPGQHWTVRVRAVTGAGRAPWASAGYTRPAPTLLLRMTEPSRATTSSGRYLDLAAQAVVDLDHPAPTAVSFVDGDGFLATGRRQQGDRWTARVDLSRVPADGSEVWAAARGQDGHWTSSPGVPLVIPTHLDPPVIESVSPDPWSSGRLTVHVSPGLERLSGDPADSVVVRIGNLSSTADPANRWTVDFDRAELLPFRGQLPSSLTAWSVYGTANNVSTAVSRSVTVG